MEFVSKSIFLKRSINTLEEIFNTLSNLPTIKLDELENDKTALVVIDMVNGFVREGALKSVRVEKLIPEISRLLEKFDELNIRKISFADSHSENCPEFDVFPPHCIKGSNEAKLVDEIAENIGLKLIQKNSTNGFHEEKFKTWLGENKLINTFIVVGDCTDICVEQFVLSLKTWFNMLNKKSRVIVPMNSVDTYDLGIHNGDLMNVMSLYNMMSNGIEVVKGVE